LPYNLLFYQGDNFAYMKNLLFALIFISTCCFGQSKKDTRIMVSVSDSINLLNRIAGTLYENGYSIAQRDDKGGFIATDEKVLKAGFPANIKLRVLIKDSIIVFTGDYKLNMSFVGQPPSYDPISYWGNKGTVAKLAWEEMDKIAKHFGVVKYSK
jgi:hypothetical protein